MSPGGMELPALVRSARPLVHAITNYATMEWVARGLLAAGARPVMARDRSEAALMAGVTGALVLNLGTWSPEVEAAMLIAGRTAQGRGIPIVLDPVGAGGMATRTRAARELLEQVQVTVVRGNAGEIMALAGETGHVSGVDSTAAGSGLRLERAARAVARRYRCVVAVTGAVDLVTDGRSSLTVRAGDPLMAQIPGAGCLASGLIGAALAAWQGDRMDGVAQALLWAGWAGEEAARRAAGPGSFAVSYLDALAGAAALPAERISQPLSERLGLYVIVSGTTPLPVVEAVLQAGCRV
ncbi:MAG: hydroxyethylthiazole kinase, partial [Bacillota bacterium]